MTNKSKTLLLTMLVFSVMAVGLYLASDSLFGGHFLKLEQHDVEESTLRIKETIAGDLLMLSSQVGDWASWDDAYNFVETGNPSFIKSNISTASFIELKANLILFVHNSGRIIYEGWFDQKSGEISGGKVSIRNHLGPDSRLLKLQYPSSSVTGILNLAEGPLLVASRPILPTKRDAPIRGTLIMGRFLNDVELARLSKESRLQFAVGRIGDPYLLPEFSEAQIDLQKNPRTLVKPSAAKGLLAYSYLNDIYGKPSIIVRVTIPTSISQQGQSLIEQFQIILIASAAASSIVLFVMLSIFCLPRKEVVGLDPQGAVSVAVAAQEPTDRGNPNDQRKDELPGKTEELKAAEPGEISEAEADDLSSDREKSN